MVFAASNADISDHIKLFLEWNPQQIAEKMQGPFSSYVLLLRDARRITDRNIETGEKNLNGKHDCWLGCLGYLILLEHIGDLFQIEGQASTQSKGIVSALEFFEPTLSEDNRKTLYALRCAFAHSYALFNKHSDPMLRHLFLLTTGTVDPLITLPKKPWTGEFNDRGTEFQTIVNIDLVGDLVEGIHKKIRLLNDNKKLGLRWGLVGQNLLDRYLHFVTKNN